MCATNSNQINCEWLKNMEIPIVDLWYFFSSKNDIKFVSIFRIWHYEGLLKMRVK